MPLWVWVMETTESILTKWLYPLKRILLVCARYLSNLVFLLLWLGKCRCPNFTPVGDGIHLDFMTALM